MSAELHRELNCIDRTTLTLHLWGFQVSQLSRGVLWTCSKESSSTQKNCLPISSPPTHLVPTRPAGSAEVEQPHLSNCCGHLLSSRAKMRFIDTWAWLCSLCSTPLRACPATVTVPAASQFYRSLKRGCGFPIKSNVLQKQKRKARQSKDNCISVHFFKKRG